MKTGPDKTDNSVPRLEGIVNVDKPAGISSARVVSVVKRLLPRGTKIGHAGTLDPFATGVLVLLVGKATRLCERLMDQPKAYDATLRLGATTATDDPESPEQAIEGAVAPDRARVEQVVGQFVGMILQKPPVYSAMKVGGRRAYDLARRGEQVQLQPRPVRVDAIEIVAYDWPTLRVSVRCGRGTYIRSLARDIGAALGTGAYLTELRRTQVGPFSTDEAVGLEQLREDGVERWLIRPEEVGLGGGKAAE